VDQHGQAGGWKKHHQWEQNIIKLVKSRRRKWAEHVTRTRYQTDTFKVLTGNRSLNHLRYTGTNEKIILKRMLRRRMAGYGV
jgi:hypothetical protein